MLLRLITIACITVNLLSLYVEVASGASVLSQPPTLLTNRRPDSCTINLPVDRLYAPVVTDDRTQQELVPVQNRRGSAWHLNIEKDREIKISCGRGNPLSVHESHYYLRLTCIRGTEFRDNKDEEVLLPEGIECSNPRKPSPIIFKNGTCYGKSANFDVDFVTESPPRKYYSVCMDEGTSGTLYSSSYIDGYSFANLLTESGGNRPDFRGQEFYPFAIKQAYKWDNAFVHLSDLLGSEDLVNEYFPTQQHRFSRGHLFPNADGVKRFEKHATFYYINTVPQWQLLNGGNWATIEQDVRDLAKELQRTLNVITGAYQVTTLPDANNNHAEIWLARDNTGKLRLPVPRIVWKVVHDPAGGAAVAIVQVNNPWFRSESDTLCNDVCSDLPWLRSHSFHTIKKGYSYCCDVNELRRVIPYIPQVQYKNLLGVEAGHIDDGDESDSGIESGGEDDKESGNEDDESDDYSYSDSGKSSSSGDDDEGYHHRVTVRKNSTLAVNRIADIFANIRLGTNKPDY